ncbi:hypothetical protein HOY80DRAFT_984213 [Tuber brumale]|nr:hypothetical protein HOY80DRAFT_984213 [Tuber brumale]
MKPSLCGTSSCAVLGADIVLYSWHLTKFLIMLAVSLIKIHLFREAYCEPTTDSIYRTGRKRFPTLGVRDWCMIKRG